MVEKQKNRNMLDWGGCDMVTYEELSKLPGQHPCGGTYCAMCGQKLWWVIYNHVEWQFCRKCKVIKSFYCEDEGQNEIDTNSLYPKVDFKFWSNEDE